MNNWPEVMEFREQSWNFTNLPNFILLVTTKKLSSDLESQHFLMFCESKIWKKEGHGKSRNGHGKILERFCQVCGNLAFVYKVTTA